MSAKPTEGGAIENPPYERRKMEIDILESVLMLLLVLSNFLNSIHLSRTKKELDLAEERIAELTAREKQHSNSIIALGEGYRTLEERFTQEVQQEIEARTDKERKEADAEQLFIDGLRGIIDFDGGGKAKGEK